MDPQPERIHRTWLNSDRYIPKRFIQPIQRFMDIEASSGVIMLVAAVVAMVWANSALSESYFGVWHLNISVDLGGLHIRADLEHLVNDGLMAIFFFVVGLEIKRELVLGELRDPKAASLPVLAALGGMIFPALIYLAFAWQAGPEAIRGWGVPMATDIAFSIGVISLLGRRIPTGIKLFLLALAIVDDIGGILVIALFYTSDLSMAWLGLGLAGLALIWIAGRAGVRSFVFYTPMAFAVWFFFLESGVHATIAGVALGFLTPALPMYSAEEFDRKARRILDTYPSRPMSPDQRERADYEALLLANISREAVAPLTRTEHRLQRWSSFVIVPLFALANAGVRFEGSIWESFATPVALGVTFGLVLGKTVGISLFTWLAVRLNLGVLPRGANWRHVVGTASIAGIGFTVALFITALAFINPALAGEAKVGIFAGSIAAGILGVAILLGSKPTPKPAAEKLGRC